MNMIELESVGKTYPMVSGPVTALKNINLAVQTGKILGIVGKSGAGTSTLIRCINLLERPSTGRVFVAGQELTALTTSQLLIARRQIGMIFQHFHLLSSRTVYENIALPLKLVNKSKKEIEQSITSLLELIDLSDKRDHYPSQLSGGQRQRVAIARALVYQPKVLLCDEATSSLDPQTTRTILRLLKNINETFQLTIVLITHEIDVIKEICDSIALLDKGEIIEQNNALAFFTQPSHELTKTFIQSSLKQTWPTFLYQLSAEKKSQNHPILRIVFYGRSTTEPWIAYLMQELGIKVSILQANIECIQNTAFGVMLTEVIGPEDNLQKGIAYLTNKGMHVEILGYVDSVVH